MKFRRSAQQQERSRSMLDVLDGIGGSVSDTAVSLLGGVKRLPRSRRVWKSLTAAVLSAVMILICSGLTVARNHITFYEGDEVFYRYTPHHDVDKILAEQDIKIGKDDVIAFSGFDKNHQATLLIKRAFDISIQADGQTHKVRMADGTVAQALKNAGVEYTQDDLINAALDEQVQPGFDIVVNRVTVETFDEIVDIPFETERPEGECPPNLREVQTRKGQNGYKTVTHQRRYIDGVEEQTTVVSETVTQAPVNEKYEFQAKVAVGASTLTYDSSELILDANGNPVNYKYKVTGKATAYSALGKPTKLVPGCVAMDLSKYPKGTKLYVKTPDGSYIYGYSKVADTGGFVHNGSGTLIDLFFNTYEESVRFGAKTVDVYVLG